MSDLISRQAAIDTEGLDEQIRCEMCRNPMHTDRGCDGNCKYDEKLYERIMQILGERIKPLPSVQSDVPDTNVGDLISRQAAIDAFLTELTKRERKNLLHTWSTVEVKYFVADMLEKLPSVQPVDKDINVSCKDAISRQVAIDICHKNYDGILDFRSDGRTVALSFEDIINSVPSVQPEPQWIPCSERLPEVGAFVLVSKKRFPRTCVWHIDHAIHEAEKKHGTICYLENLMTIAYLHGCHCLNHIRKENNNGYYAWKPNARTNRKKIEYQSHR